MIVNDFVRLKPGETVAVFGDDSHRAEAAAVLAAVRALGNEVVGVDVAQQVAALRASEEFWIDPPAHLRALIQATNVNIFVVDETYGFRLDHKVSRLFRTGPDCSIFKVDEGLGTWNLSGSDIAYVNELGGHIQSALNGAHEVHITAPGGTDLRLSLAGRTCLPIMPVPERGEAYGLSVPLWGEYNWAPIENSATGAIVFDGLTEARAEMGTVAAPVTVTVSGGRVTAVHGESDADDFRRLFALDEGSNVVGELGVGGNPRAQFGRETEKALLGTIHIGFGDNHVYPGGLNRSEVHFDATVRGVTIVADGVTVIRDGAPVEFDEQVRGEQHGGAS